MTPPSSPAALPNPPRRALALDALRGFAILAMALSGMIPHGMRPDWTSHLPAWMYHAQKPPPAHAFDPNLPGLTWVDLVFPFFLFSMGAAMPLALSARIDRGARWPGLAAYALRRGVLLLAFALYVQHIVPASFARGGAVSTARWWWALAAFALLFPALARLPAAWPARRTALVRAIGWGGAIAVLATLRTPDGRGFSLGRSDIILVVLAHTATAGALLWLISRRSLPLRMGLILAVFAAVLGAEAPGWVREVWHRQPMAWLEAAAARFGVDLGTAQGTRLLLLGYLKYLLIVLPGTIAGDLLLAWQRGGPDGGGRGWPAWRHLAIAALMLGLTVLLLGGLQARWLPQTTFATLAACAAGAGLLGSPRTPLEGLLRRLYGWGVLWLAVGLLLEPYEGGIKKDHATLSYYFVTSGMALLALVFLMVLIDALGQRRWLGLLIASGQNPMIAYAGIRNLVPPVLHLTGLEPVLARALATPWLGVVHAGLKTLLVAAAASLCTRLRIIWRT